MNGSKVNGQVECKIFKQFFFLKASQIKNYFMTFRHWWLFGINFIVYFLTNPRIRKAYLRFLADMLCLKRTQKPKNTEEQSTFWARGIEQGDGNHDLEDIS